MVNAHLVKSLAVIRMKKGQNYCKKPLNWGYQWLEFRNFNKKFSKFKNFRFHIGIGFNDTQVICKAIKDARNLFEVGTKTGHKMTIFDIGGGFPGSDKMGKIPFKKVRNHKFSNFL